MSARRPIGAALPTWRAYILQEVSEACLAEGVGGFPACLFRLAHTVDPPLARVAVPGGPTLRVAAADEQRHAASCADALGARLTRDACVQRILNCVAIGPARQCDCGTNLRICIHVACQQTRPLAACGHHRPDHRRMRPLGWTGWNDGDAPGPPTWPRSGWGRRTHEMTTRSGEGAC